MAIALATRTDPKTEPRGDAGAVFRMANLTKVYQMGEVAVIVDPSERISDSTRVHVR